MTKKKKQKSKKLQTKAVIEKKLQTKAVIEKWLARALSLSVRDKMRSFNIEGVYFNADEKELVATDGRAMLIVKIKISGVLIPLDLETGLYDVIGDTLLKKDIEQEKINFPNYQTALPSNANKVCGGDILWGIIDCMIKNNVYLNIWRYANVLRILDKLALNWTFTNDAPLLSVLMEADSNQYNIKYVIMPVNYL